MPADRAIAIGGDKDAAIGREVGAPSNAGSGFFPDLRALGVKAAKGMFGAQRKAGAIVADGKRTARLSG